MVSARGLPELREEQEGVSHCPPPSCCRAHSLYQPKGVGVVDILPMPHQLWLEFACPKEEVSALCLPGMGWAIKSLFSYKLGSSQAGRGAGQRHCGVTVDLMPSILQAGLTFSTGNRQGQTHHFNLREPMNCPLPPEKHCSNQRLGETSDLYSGKGGWLLNQQRTSSTAWGRGEDIHAHALGCAAGASVKLPSQCQQEHLPGDLILCPEAAGDFHREPLSLVRILQEEQERGRAGQGQGPGAERICRWDQACSLGELG